MAYQDIWWTSEDGLRLYGREYAPAGPAKALPVICLHGLTRNVRDFEAVAPWLAAQGRRTFALDMRGRGRSERDPRPERYNPGVYAQDVARFMAERGIGQAVFVGTSMGGLISLVLSALAPETVAAVAFNDVGPEVSPEGLERIRGYVGQPVAVRSWAEAADYARRVAQIEPTSSDDLFLTIARRLFREDAEGRIALDYDSAISAGLSRSDDEGPVPNVWPAYEQLAKARPILVLRGARSDILSEATVRRMGELAADFTACEAPGVGHAPTLDEPAARAALQAFLTRLP